MTEPQFPEAQHLANGLNNFFTGESGAFLPFKEVTAGLTAAQAAHVPAEKFNSVWAVVNHVRFWEEFTIAVLKGEKPPVDRSSPDYNWPPIGAPDDDAAWTAAREEALRVNQQLVDLVASLSEEQLNRQVVGAPAHQLVQGIIAHNAYHTAEIICIRHLQQLWLPA